MARVPDANRETFPDDLKHVWDRSVKRRKGDPGGLVRAMGNNPRVLLGYARYGNQLWPHCGVDAATRELAILRTARLAGCEYEWHHHVARGRQEGLTDERIVGLNAWRESALYSEAECALLAWLDALAESDAPPQDLFDELARHYPTDAVVGLTLLSTYYAGTAKFIAAMDIQLEVPFIGWRLED